MQVKPNKFMEKKMKHILLVDDNKSTNFFNKRIIEKIGLAEKISVAENGAEALSYFDYNNEDTIKPELVFLDINMPILNGMEFLDNYNRLNYENKAAVVMMIGTPLLSDDRKKIETYEFVVEKSDKMLSKDFLIKLATKLASINRIEKIAI